MYRLARPEVQSPSCAVSKHIVKAPSQGADLLLHRLLNACVGFVVHIGAGSQHPGRVRMSILQPVATQYPCHCPAVSLQ